MAIRHRAQPYLSGLGNGVHHYHGSNNNRNNKVRGGDSNSLTDDEAASADQDDKYYAAFFLRRQPEAQSRKRVAHAAAAAAGWTYEYHDPSAGHDTLHDPSRPEAFGPWHVAAFALLGAVILLSALFLHLLADGSSGPGESSWHGKRHKHAHTVKRRGGGRSTAAVRHQRHLYKKKTDEWSDNDDEEPYDQIYQDHEDESDAADTELLSESVRGVGAYRRLDSSNNDDITFARPPSYYHHHMPQQQSRHRKNSSQTAAGTLPVQQQQPQLSHPSQPYATRNLYQAPSYRYPLPSSTQRVPASPLPLRPTGGGPTATLLSPPPPLVEDVPQVQQQEQDEDRVILPAVSSLDASVPTGPDAPFSSPRRASAVSAGVSLTTSSGKESWASRNHSSSSSSQHHRSPAPRRSSGRRSPPSVTIREPPPVLPEGGGGGSTTPEVAPRELLLPPPAMVAGTPILLGEKTPRVRNRGKLVMGTPPRHHGKDDDNGKSGLDHSDDPTTPAAVVMPFLPNLASVGTDTESQDNGEDSKDAGAAINLQEIPLLARMESGQTPSLPPPPPHQNWPPPALDAPASLRGQSTHFLQIQESIDDTLSLDSNDPRKNIVHKRPDQLMYTDAAASLQGAVDFNELELHQVIGGGGFGQVWKAVWNGTPVAVKVLTGSAQAHSVPRAILEEFAAEINLLKGMRHPNICLYMGACLAPPNRAIITELAAHGSLWDALRLPLAPPYVAADGITHQAWPLELAQPDPRHGAPPGGHRTIPHMAPAGSWPWVLVKKVACGSARGMNYLHNGKPPVLHRDLKSANILLDESYTPKVCDFGLSRLKAKDRSMTGNCGTVQWMAPEVLANQAYNEKADVYSYGIILWELLSRECPYDDMSAIQCALAVLNRNHRPEIPRWCPPPLQVLIRSCLKKDPNERPSFTEILHALDEMP